MSETVLDASALLAYLHEESGAENVATVPHDSVISTINLMEVFSKLLRDGIDVERVQTVLGQCCRRAIALDRSQAETAAVIHSATARQNVSYADCACVALGAERQSPVLTADKKWRSLHVGFDVTIEMIRWTRSDERRLEEAMDDSRIYLEAEDASRNCFYSIEVGRDLFGVWLVDVDLDV